MKNDGVKEVPLHVVKIHYGAKSFITLNPFKHTQIKPVDIKIESTDVDVFNDCLLAIYKRFGNADKMTYNEEIFLMEEN